MKSIFRILLFFINVHLHDALLNGKQGESSPGKDLTLENHSGSHYQMRWHDDIYVELSCSVYS